MTTVVLDADTIENRELCSWCEQHPNRPCPACNARRRHAVQLIERRGLSVSATAEQMGLPAARIERLLEEEADRRTLLQFRQDRVDNAPLRQRFLTLRRRDPALTATEIAQRIGTSPIQVERWLGLRPTAPKVDRRGRIYAARILTTVSVENAGRLARAMGANPNEFDGA
jgi:predicted nucleic acid-binding Zn ribbon protein